VVESSTHQTKHRIVAEIYKASLTLVLYHWRFRRDHSPHTREDGPK
jgi:hypothetical protein